MEAKVIDLSKLRKATGWQGTDQSGKVNPITQEDLSQRLNIDQSQVSRYENDPSSIPLDLLFHWLQALGVRLEDAFEMAGKNEPLGINPGLPWQKLQRNCGLLMEYVHGAKATVRNFRESAFNAESLRVLAQELRRKPNIVFTGKFDSGKSRLANGLLGRRDLPDKYQPATRLITYVCHINDKPSWLREEVLILNRNFDFSRDISMLDSLSIDEVNKNYKVVAGNLEILKAYGTHDGKYSEVKDAKYALVYMDSPLLEACNIVDLPGYGASEDEDVERAREGGKVADILVYTSNSTGFLDAEDFVRMQYEVSRLPAFEGSVKDYPLLGNLYIVATHASRDKTQEDLDAILTTASNRLYQTMSETWRALSTARGRTIDAGVLRARMFTYWAELPDRRKNLEECMTSYLATTLPKVKNGILDQTVAEYKSEADKELSARIAEYQAIMEDTTNAERTYEELKRNEPTRKKRVENTKLNIINQIRAHRKEHLDELTRVYEENLNIDGLERLIKGKYKEKNEAQRYLGTYLLDHIQGRLSSVGEEKAKLLKLEIDEFLQIYDMALTSASADIEKPGLSIPFDAKGAFLAGLTGLATLGALSIWVSTMGNLGGYILAAKLSGWLATVGISVGGKALITYLASIGGPVTAGIAIALAVAAAIWSIFGDSWQRRLAKKTIDAFNTKDVQKKFTENINAFWRDTEIAFRDGAESVEKKFMKNLKHLDDVIKGRISRDTLKAKIAQFNKVKDFLANTPWVPLA